MAVSTFGLAPHLRRLKDPRVARCRRHLLGDIVTMALCAVIGNANTWEEIAAFARCRRDWFQGFLELPHGIPSQHTFERVFDRLNPQTLQRVLLDWLHGVSDLLGVRHIAIDGKTLRGSARQSAPNQYLHLVSAWATEANLTLGQVAVEEKSNEITAIPRLLELLDIKGAFVTIDAMGCQKEIARQIVDQGGYYVLTVKDNHEQLKADIETCFEKAYATNCAGLEYDWHETEETGHGRHEKRMYEIICEPEGIRNQDAWASLLVIGKCWSERTVNGKTSVEERLFIGNRRCSARQYGKVLRNHWRIENNLHWQLDVSFGEDGRRIHKRHSGENVALLCRLALGLLKQHPSKGSIKCKRLQAAMDVAFLEQTLAPERKMGEPK
jgi:predicted transposase YbfD/YdcC